MKTSKLVLIILFVYYKKQIDILNYRRLPYLKMYALYYKRCGYKLDDYIEGGHKTHNNTHSYTILLVASSTIYESNLIEKGMWQIVNNTAFYNVQEEYK